MFPSLDKRVVFMGLNDKSLLVQDMNDLSKFSAVRFLNIGGQPSPPTVSGKYAYIIPAAKCLVRVDPNILLAQNQTVEIDMKNIKDSFLEQGV